MIEFFCSLLFSAVVGAVAWGITGTLGVGLTVFALCMIIIWGCFVIIDGDWNWFD